MAERKSSKGNGAAKRMANKVRQAHRERSWLRGRKRKEERVKAQLLREKDNDIRRMNGEPTPWEEAEAIRAYRRGRRR